MHSEQLHPMRRLLSMDRKPTFCFCFVTHVRLTCAQGVSGPRLALDESQEKDSTAGEGGQWESRVAGRVS